MITPLYTLTCRVPADQMADTLMQLTTLLLQTPYAFRQTFQQAGHSDMDIFDTQQQLIVRVMLQVGAPHTPISLIAAASPQTALEAEPLPLVQALTQLWAPTTVSGS